MAMQSNWLQVPPEENAPTLNTVSPCLTLCDIHCDHYIRLVAVDVSLGGSGAEDDAEPTATLKVFRGLDLKMEQTLPGIPSAIESLYVEENEPKTPILAVAINDHILFYRNCKPYFKYTVPEQPIEELERDIWRQLPLVGEEQQAELYKSLDTIERPKMSRKSQKMLLLWGEERKNFIQTHAETPLSQSAHVMALRALQRVSSEASEPPSHLVVALDNGAIMILEAQSFGLVYEAHTCPGGGETVPSLLAVHGTYETDFRIVVGTRYGGIYLLRKSTNEGQEVLKLPHPLTGMLLLPVDQTIVVSTYADRRLVCYSKKGKQLYGVALEAAPVCMTLVPLDFWGRTFVCVSLEGGAVQFYQQKQLIDEFQVEATVTALIFGRMGYEENVLTLITVEGKILVKILRRLAIFEPSRMAGAKGGQARVDRKVDISVLDKPKKSSIFVEQAAREKLNAKETYRSFQADLWRLRHTAASATIDALNASESTFSGDLFNASVTMSAEVRGIGPEFCVFLNIQNMSPDKVAGDLSVLLHADRRHYKIPHTFAKLPVILAGFPLKIDFDVTVILDPLTKLPPHTLTVLNSFIRVFLLKPEQCKPLLAAVVPMPQSEASF